MPYQPQFGTTGGAECVSGAPNEIWSYGEEGRKLILKAVKRRVDITRPDKRTVFLAAGPCTPQKIYDIFLALCPQ